MENNKKTKNNIEKENKRKINFKNIYETYKKFYIDNLKGKQLIIFIIMLIIYFVMLNFFLNNSTEIKNEIINSNIVEKTFFYSLIQDKIPLLALIIFAGITPFFFLSVMGLIGSYTLAFEVCCTYFISGNILSIIIGSIGNIIQIVAISLSVSVGIYYCILSTKKFRYSQHMSFGLKDVKKTFYEMTKNEEKLKKLYEKETKKAEKRKILNVKIPYINLLISFVISVIILSLGAFIANIF